MRQVNFYFAMGRLKSKTFRKKKRDTPQKTLFFRRIGLKKQMRNEIYETLPEEDEVKKFQAQSTLVKEIELDMKSSEDISPPDLVIDTTCSSDTEDSSVFDSCSSPPSPELFRDEHYVEQYGFPLDDELTDLHFPIKNSTLLEGSNAETILTYHAPNLSTILDAPTILAENGIQDIRDPLNGSKLVTDPISAYETSTVTKKAIILKKRVWFRSPLFSERSRRETMSAPTKKIVSSKTITKQASPPNPYKNIETETLQVNGDNNAHGGTFFDFSCNSERDSYLCKMRERCIKLKTTALFPLTAVRPNESAVL